MEKMLIMDDDRPALLRLSQSVSKLYPDQFEIHLAADEKDIDIAYVDIDIFLADIEINDPAKDSVNGINVAEKMKRENPRVQIIFVSAHHKYAQDIFEAEPVWYIQKPFSEETLKRSVDKALINLNRYSEEFYTVSVGNEINRIEYRKIIYIESNKRMVRLVTESGDFKFYSKLADVKKELSDDFIRVHQSFVVNMSHIKKFDSNVITMSDGSLIPVSRSRIRESLNSYTMFLGRKLE